MFWVVFEALCLLITWSEIHAQGNSFYSVVAPGTLRSNYKYNVVFTLHAAVDNCRFRVGIKGPSYNDQLDFDMRPISSKVIQFQMPKLELGVYKLHVDGLSGMVFTNVTKLLHAHNAPMALLQTDKEIYRPGELIRYWLLLLNEKLQAAELASPLLVMLTDGAGSVVQQLQNARLINGAYNGAYQLPAQVAAGHWQISFSSGDGEFTKTKIIEVNNRAQPKFLVGLETAKAVAIQEGIIRLTVRARYSFGLAVLGRAIVTLTIWRSTAKNLTQTFELHGKQTVDVDISGWSASESDLKDMSIVQLNAVVEERFTNTKQSAYAELKLYKKRFRLRRLQVPATYREGVPLIYRLAVSTVSGEPLSQSQSEMKLIFEQPIRRVSKLAADFGLSIQPFEPLTFAANLDSEGNANFSLLFNYSLPNYLRVRAVFEDVNLPLSSLKHANKSIACNEPIKLNVLTKRPRFNENLIVRVSLPPGLPYLIYAFVARGNIVKSQLVHIKAQQSIDIKFRTVSTMVPTLAVFVYYIKNGMLEFQELIVHIEKEFRNFLNLTVPQLAKPGTQLKMGVSTMPGSVVGVAAFDYSALWQRSRSRLNKAQIYEQLEHYTTTTPVSSGLGRYPGFVSGLVTMTNAHFVYEKSPIDYEMRREHHENSFVDQSSVAQFGPNSLSDTQTFLEDIDATWLWYFEPRTKSKNFTIVQTLPDITTSWSFVAFSLHPSTGLAVLDIAPKVHVKGDVFVTCQYPQMLQLGELARLSLYVINNAETSYSATATLSKSFAYDWLRQLSNTQLTVNATRPEHEQQLNDGLYLIIRAKKLGSLNLNITIRTQRTTTRLHLNMLVKAAGIACVRSDIAVVHLQQRATATGELDLKLTKPWAKDSVQRVQLSAVGDMLGPAINQMDELLLSFTLGDTQRRLALLAQSTAVLQYLAAVHKLKPSVRSKAIEFIQLGQRRLLQQLSSWTSGKANNIWLTAQTLLCLLQGASYVPVKHEYILKGLNYLATWLQMTLSDRDKAGLAESNEENELITLAFVLLTFHEAKHLTSKYASINGQGVSYLAKSIVAYDEPYKLAIGAYVLQLNKHPTAALLLRRLDAYANSEENWKWWTDENNANRTQLPLRIAMWRPSLDVRITAYTLMAQLEAQWTTTAVWPIVRWLLAQRDHLGGYTKPQDTSIGLQALTKFAQRIGLTEGVSNMSLQFALTTIKLNRPLRLAINSANLLLSQTLTLPASTRRVTYTASGQGNALLQLTAFYHSTQLPAAAWFMVDITANATNASEQDKSKLSLKVCIEYTPLTAERQFAQTSAHVKIALPSGFVADVVQVESINHLLWIERVQLQDADTLVSATTQTLTAGNANCLNVVAENTFLVAQQRRAYVHVIDVKQASRAGLGFYSVQNSLCDICKAPSCFSQCKNTNSL